MNFHCCTDNLMCQILYKHRHDGVHGQFQATIRVIREIRGHSFPRPKTGRLLFADYADLKSAEFAKSPFQILYKTGRAGCTLPSA